LISSSCPSYGLKIKIFINRRLSLQSQRTITFLLFEIGGGFRPIKFCLFLKRRKKIHTVRRRPSVYETKKNKIKRAYLPLITILYAPILYSLFVWNYCRFYLHFVRFSCRLLNSGVTVLTFKPNRRRLSLFGDFFFPRQLRSRIDAFMLRT